MKKMTFLACAAMLASACMFTACKKDKVSNELQEVEEQGTYSGEVVKTQFAISLPGQLGSKKNPRRMTGETVQKDGFDDFVGMTGIKLIPFATAGTITGGDARLGENIALAELVKADVNAKTSKAKVYSNVSIPLTTASFLFYAKSSTSGTDSQVGALVASDLTNEPDLTGATPSTITFNLKPIQKYPSNLFIDGQVAPALMAYLTAVANASDGAKCWYEYEDSDDAGMKAMFDTYKSMKGLSSFEVKRVLTDLWVSLKPLSSPIAMAIKTAINGGTYGSVAADEVVLAPALENFPTSAGLPQGSVSLAWNEGSHSFTQGAYSNMAALDKYTYPAQLWYFVNSRIKTSNTSKQTAYDNNANTWGQILDLHTDATSVNTLTRAVAIQNQIQFAVARLDVQVKIKDGASVLEDNSATVEGIATDVACTSGFPITAVFVGGQQQVGYDFTANTSEPEYTIYDNVMPFTSADIAADLNKAMPGTYSALNHTLVLENGTSDVKIAVEMENTTGVDFYGVGGQLIPKGGKFYMVALLAASASSSETGGHVFKQDYTTTAKLTIQDLKKAYNTIPDLRTPKLELGFSVDLTWQAGHTYEVNFTE